jgi:hypothetical protein
MIVALAGRRIDVAGATPPRFPLANVALVERRLGALVSSGACGADLVALTVARARHMHRRIVLPFGRDDFRASSVTDRPGNWGPVYDQVLRELETSGDVVTLAGHAVKDAAYAAANETILREAAALARQHGTEVIAVLVWEGASRDGDDMTAAFGDAARRRGYRVDHVITL